MWGSSLVPSRVYFGRPLTLSSEEAIVREIVPSFYPGWCSRLFALANRTSPPPLANQVFHKQAQPFSERATIFRCDSICREWSTARCGYDFLRCYVLPHVISRSSRLLGIISEEGRISRYVSLQALNFMSRLRVIHLGLGV